MELEKYTDIQTKNGKPTGLKTAKYREVLGVKKNSSGQKEVEITTNVLDRDDQLNLLATIIEQVADSIALDTPEYAYAKVKFAEIRNILNG